MDITHKINARKKNKTISKVKTWLRTEGMVKLILFAKVVILSYIYFLGLPTVTFANDTFSLGNITKPSLMALALVVVWLTWEHQSLQKQHGVK